MDTPNNTNTPNISQPTPPVANPPVAATVPSSPAPELPIVTPAMGSEKLSEQRPKKLPVSPQQVLERLKALPKKIKILIGMLIVLMILVFLLMSTSAGRRVRESILPTPVPAPTATPQAPDLFNPSPYANDPEIKDIETRLSDFDQKLNQINLREDTLRAPTLDWNVDFKKK